MNLEESRERHLCNQFSGSRKEENVAARPHDDDLHGRQRTCWTGVGGCEDWEPKFGRKRNVGDRIYPPESVTDPNGQRGAGKTASHSVDCGGSGGCARGLWQGQEME